MISIYIEIIFFSKFDAFNAYDIKTVLLKFDKSVPFESTRIS